MASETLYSAIQTIPIIDHHCHNLSPQPGEFQSCFSEASGDALRFANTTLACQRGCRDAAEILGCEPTIQAVEAQRRALGFEEVLTFSDMFLL